MPSPKIIGESIKNTSAIRKLGEKAVFKTRRFTVFDSRLNINGQIVNKPYIRQNDCAEILAITSSGHIILIKSYRPELNSYVYELPAGTLKASERPSRTAIRELEEETGYKARKVRYMFSGYPLLGYSDCKLYFFLATGLQEKEQHLEKDEYINVQLFKPTEILKMLKEGKIKDMCVITAMDYYYYVTKEGRRLVTYANPG